MSALQMERRASSWNDMYRWLVILPVLFVMHGLSYFTRINVSFAMSGMQEAFAVTAAVAGLVSGVAYFGFAILQIPSGHLANKKSASKIIVIFGLLTGIFATAQGFSTSIEMLIAFRFLIGLAQGALMPPCFVLLSRWFVLGERTRATNVFMCYIASAPLLMSPVCGYILENVHWFGMDSWRWMLILGGSIPFFWAILFYFVMRDDPTLSKNIGQKELDYITAEIAEEAKRPKITRAKSYWRAALNRNFILYTFAWLLMAIGVNGITIWLPEIIKQVSKSGFDKVGMIATIPWVVTLTALFIAGYVNDKWRNRKWLLVILMGVGGIGLYASATAGASDPWLAVAFITVAMMFAMTAAPIFAGGMNEFIAPAMLGGLLGIALTVVNIGGFFGPPLAGWVIAESGGNKLAGVIFLAGCYLLGAFLMLLCNMKPTKK